MRTEQAWRAYTQVSEVERTDATSQPTRRRRRAVGHEHEAVALPSAALVADAAAPELVVVQIDLLDTTGAVTQTPAPDDTPVVHQPRTGGTRPSGMAPTAVEHILKAVRLPAPDPYLSDVPAVVGGNRRAPLAEDIPPPDPRFEVNSQTERILRVMSATLQAGAGKANNGWSRAFSAYGLSGTGKNTLARQLAASVHTVDANGNETQGMNYAEVNVTPEMSLEEGIGTTTLTTDPVTGATVSRADG